MSTSIAAGDSFHWRETGYILGGWVVITVIAGVVTGISNSCNVTIPWPRLVANQTAQFGVWALLTPGIFWLTRLRFRSNGRFTALQFGGLFAAIGLVTTLRPLIHNVALHSPDERHEYIAWMGAAFLRNAHLDGLVYVGLFLAGIALTHYRRSQERGRRAAALEAQLSKAQLNVLQTQINPHFLFNALNTISSLAADDPATTRRVLSRLSSLLRRSLDSTEGAEIALGEELSFVRQYLDIMQIRYGSQLQTNIDVPETVEGALVPAFCLQILVENAIKHGISQVARPGRISVCAWQAGDRLVVEVLDNGPGCELEEPIGDSGVGLVNVRSRLRHLYGDDAELSLCNVDANDARAEEAGARVTLRLPYIRMASDSQMRSLLTFDEKLPHGSAVTSRGSERVR